jgi:hypothetical protein
MRYLTLAIVLDRGNRIKCSIVNWIKRSMGDWIKFSIVNWIKYSIVNWIKYSVGNWIKYSILYPEESNLLGILSVPKHMEES